MSSTRIVGAVAALSVVLVGCGHGAVQEANGETTTTSAARTTTSQPPRDTSSSAPPPIAAGPIQPSEASSLPIAPGSIPGDLMFDLLNSSSTDSTTSPTENSLEPCFFTHTLVSDAAVFGEPLAFHERRYDGFSNALLLQDIGIYPDAAAAQDAYRVIADGVQACDSTVMPGISFGVITTSSSEWSDSTCAGNDQVVQNVLIRVLACRVGDPAGLTSVVAQTISHAINP